MASQSDRVLRGDQVVLRRAGLGDVDAPVAIRATPEVHARWGGDDLRADVVDAIDDPDLHFLTIEVDGGVIGAIQWSEESDPMYRHAGVDMFLARPTCTVMGSELTLRRRWSAISSRTSGITVS